MNRENIANNCGGARAAALDETLLAMSVEGYLNAVSLLQAAIYMAEGLRDIQDSNSLYRSLPRLLEQAKANIEPAGSIVMDLEWRNQTQPTSSAENGGDA